MAFQPTTTEAGGDAAGDGDTKELSGGSKQKPCKALNKELLQLWENTKFCFLFGRLQTFGRKNHNRFFTCNEQSKYLLWTLAQQGAADPLDGSIAHKNLRETSLIK